MSCKVFQRVQDDRANRVVEELVLELADDFTPAAAFSAFLDIVEPPAGTYRLDCGRRGSATISYDPRRT